VDKLSPLVGFHSPQLLLHIVDFKLVDFVIAFTTISFAKILKVLSSGFRVSSHLDVDKNDSGTKVNPSISTFSLTSTAHS
jgi:hypothetical protein